jgi:hypothetical protein
MAKAKVIGNCERGHRWLEIGYAPRASRYRCSRCKVDGLRTTAEYWDGVPITSADAPHYYERRNGDRIDETNCVYFIVADSIGMVKIGTTRRLAVRFSDLQVACPVPLRLAYHRPGDRRIERQYHKKFDAYWSHGEWFHFDGELRDFLEIVAKDFAAKAAAQKQP